MNIENFINEFVAKNTYITKENAANEAMIGLKMYDEPLVAYASAEDGIFHEYATKKEILQNKFMPPKEWLNEASTVISVFFPLSDEVKKSNAANMDMPSIEWLQARYEGQEMIVRCTKALVEYLQSSGYAAAAPCVDERKWLSMGDEEHQDNSYFVPNWSERHAAFAAGHGTFSLSRGLITKRGVAGRFTSVITNYFHAPTPREYTDIYEYCNKCGKCIANCPAGAISFEHGKQHYPCMLFLDKVEEMCSPRYGCGKCQVAVPCQNGIPK
ncbi:MAG: 4Fe-4S binding protein [Eubacteriales bacterium]